MVDSTRNRSAERLIDILVELQNYGVVSRYNLMKKYNITERTAYRDLNMLSPFIGKRTAWTVWSESDELDKVVSTK